MTMHDDTDNRFANLELDLPTGEKPAKHKAALNEAEKASGKTIAEKIAAGEMSFKEAEGTMSISSELAFRPAADLLPRNVTVSLNESTEDLAERAVLRVLGISGKGKRIKGQGEKNLDVSGLIDKGERILDSAVRRRWERLPTATEISAQVQAVIAAERRETLDVDCKELYLGKDGSLYLQGHKPVAEGNAPHRVSAVAYSQIAERAPMSKPLAYNLNAWAPHSGASVRARRMMQQGNATPLVFAAVGPRYNEFDADKAVKALVERLPTEARARWHYHGDGGTWKIEATLARPLDVEGDLHEMGLWLQSSDDGRMGVRFGFSATRWTCSNTLRILHKATLKSMRHVGSVTRFLEEFDNILNLAEDAFAVFSRVWGEARHRPILDAYSGEAISVQDAVVRLVTATSGDKFRLHAPGCSPEVLAGRIMTSWQEEPDESVQGLVNAITRASHEWQWRPSSWAEEDLEDQAADLLYARVLELPAPAPVAA